MIQFDNESRMRIISDLNNQPSSDKWAAMAAGMEAPFSIVILYKIITCADLLYTGLGKGNGAYLNK